MTKEVSSSAPEFTLAQVETKTSLMCTLKDSTKILIVIAKIAVVAIDNNVIRNSSDHMTKEVNSSAPEFTLAQVETKTSLMCTLKDSTKILIVIAKIAVVAIDNNVIRNSSDAW